MTEVICIAAGIIVGGFMGVVVMSIMQINRINQYERRIMKLKKQLEASRKWFALYCFMHYTSLDILSRQHVPVRDRLVLLMTRIRDHYLQYLILLQV